MKKLYTLAALTLGFFTASASAETLNLTFTRTSITASSVTVNTSGINGVTASLDNVSHNLKATADKVTSAIICPNVNGNTSPTITFQFTINGLPADYDLTDLSLDIHALNGNSGYQMPDDNVVRQFNVKADVNGSTYGSLNDIDIADGINPGGERHKVWTITPAAAVETSSPLTVTLTVTKGTSNSGCFFGISGITLNLDKKAGIGSINTDEATGANEIFDLNGRRLKEPVRGAINIINGAKVLVK